MAAPCPLSILIPTKNEAANLAACLGSARFADEIVVVDSGSTDGTVELARAAQARVVDFRWDGHFPKKKNWALANIDWAHEWVFILDADERITPECARELQELLVAPDCDGYYVNRRFWFIDGWLRHCGYYPSWNLRLFKHRLGRYEQFRGVEETGSGDNEVHEHVQLAGRVGWLRGELEHYAFPTISVWVEKHNRYSNWEAQMLRSATDREATAQTDLAPELARKRRLKNLARRLPFRPSLRFFYHYVWRAGFLDGYRGYIFCRLMAIYEFLSTAKARELARASRPRE
jgi:glycosyltransferase involved in cell wall biosynthesis